MRDMGPAFLLVAVETCYGIAGFLLYRNRCLNHPAWDSEWIVFYGPFLATVAVIFGIGCLYLPKRWSLASRNGIAFAIAVTATFLAFGTYLTIAINKYGA